jgi:hypothetical protein
MAEEFAPVVVDLGKKSRKKVKDLKRGRGSLQAEAMDAAAEVKQHFGAEAAGKEFVPIVVVYTKKQRGTRGMKLPKLF